MPSAGAMSLAAEVTVWGLNSGQIQFGTMVGTIGAVALSLLLAAVSLVNGWRERAKRRRDDAKDREWSQARQVHWWMEPCAEHPRPLDIDDYLMSNRIYGECWGQSVMIENLSDRPVHDVVVDIPDRRVADKLRTWTGAFDLGPRSSRRIHFTGEGECLIDPVFREDARGVRFADSEGELWLRDESGQLSRSDHSVEAEVERAEGHQLRIDRELREVLAHPDWPFMNGRDRRYLTKMRLQVRALRLEGTEQARARQFRLMDRASEFARSKQIPPGMSWEDDLFHVSTW